ncbi:putative methyltransferase [Thelonectria olida]|uniref:Methyltransferase n=1 Tax=Thelonectria olida TaxID=1576542 RepID=A0A9P8VXZ3_9HYPO|nr:putative methyltransferase [Thelonectria olida]
MTYNKVVIVCGPVTHRESQQQHGNWHGGGDGNDEVDQDRGFEFTFDCSMARVGAGRGENGSIIESDSIPSTMAASSSIGEATSTSSDINWSLGNDDSASLSDSVQAFPEEFGRTYHAYRAGSYAFPNDAPEQERLELQGEAIKMLLGNKLFFAPLSHSNPPRTILDLATGVGDWAIQMGDQFPDSLIIGTDLSPIQPAEVPPNVHFYVEDSTDPWDFNQKFDYIHTRFTCGCWSSFETQIAEQAFAALEPGGWFESQEIDGNICCDDNTLAPDGPLAVWSNDLITASEKLGRPAIVGINLKEIFERVGFVDVQQRIYKMPIGGWAKDQRLKEIGYMWGINVLDGVTGFSLQLFSKAFERTSAQIEVSLIDVRRDLTNHRIHAYMPAFIVWGRKPQLGEK